MSEEQKDLNELITLAEEVKNKIAESNLPVDALQSVEGHVNELIDLAKKEQIVNEIEAEVQEELKAEVVEGDGVSEETKELTEEEKHELFIQMLKESKIKFRPVKHNGNVTTNQFGTAHKKERKHKNRLQNKSRKANR